MFRKRVRVTGRPTEEWARVGDQQVEFVHRRGTDEFGAAGEFYR